MAIPSRKIILSGKDFTRQGRCEKNPKRFRCSAGRLIGDMMFAIMRHLILLMLVAALTWGQGPRFAVTYPAAAAGPLDGRLLVMLSTDPSAEPRFQIVDGPKTQLGFAIDVDGWQADVAAVVDAKAVGYPLESLTKVPAGEYYVQALLHRYETFHRADGHVVKLPMDRGEGQQWNRAPGNLYSTPRKITWDPAHPATVTIALDKAIPPIEAPKDSKYIRHIRMRSERLSKFWGRDMYLGAVVMLPEGWETHPAAHYPVAINHGHFPYTIDSLRSTPPDPDLKPDYSERFRVAGYNKIVQEYNYRLYKDWTGPNFPRFLVVEIQHANPYYDDSYAVNSENVGPYGDAIVYELLPEIEKRFRGIGQGWARVMYGGSTGGWEALAAQVFYPDEFNAAYASCPDPIDFRAYTTVDLYHDKNAYYLDSPFKKTARPGQRNYLGHVSTSLPEMNRRELLLGTHSRSGQQFDIWEAVYSPVGKDGYPQRIFNKETGVIDPAVASYWRDHYDLAHIIQRDWKTLGPKLTGKIHLYVGDMDTYYLNNAVYLAEDMLKSLKNPTANALVDYGDRAEHCYNGDHDNPIWIGRLRYHQIFLPLAVERILKTAPAGADLTSWRY